ncbi:gamma-mobile-trio protein GmtX [Shewanella colwelliana]|uniref:gamma-mobile-trio protein GmtX n=1 Tax=Shewanella colwelliana TaxID=23 RepID=UPI0022AE86BD|nr:gamma-mobile-trio protein GmtX [Shewanella colwelliana]MCZ4338188.1 gamma-mobile-trio protein GmtX [Shewanella colwelliana]
MTKIMPKEVLEQLMTTATSRTRRTLENIYQVCTEQQERGLNEFSYATIARLGKDRGIPAATSIRNNTGEHYRTLIKSFADLNLKPDKPTSNTNRGKSFTWIEELKDPVVKLQANILYSQKLAAEKLVKEIAPIDQVIEIFDGDSSKSTQQKLTDLEREALEHLISSEFMRKQKLELGPNGSILTSDEKETFFPVATLDAIKKALQHL